MNVTDNHIEWQTDKPYFTLIKHKEFNRVGINMSIVIENIPIDTLDEEIHETLIDILLEDTNLNGFIWAPLIKNEMITLFCYISTDDNYIIPKVFFKFHPKKDCSFFIFQSKSEDSIMKKLFEKIKNH